MKTAFSAVTHRGVDPDTVRQIVTRAQQEIGFCCMNNHRVLITTITSN
jgi:hypothetical protein